MALMEMTGRPRVWLHRYLPAEAAGLVATVVCTLLALEWSGNILLAALVGTWTESLGFYSVIFWRDLQRRGGASWSSLRATFTAMLVEFGPAELFDSLLVGPAVLALALVIFPSPLFGTIVGKLAADAIFYLLTITSYELIKRR
ncbi:hypothetical protein EYB53_005830 [Candidatus Chloroploca sp. M-50]|uniref:Uncharacterized protein n=1 Tax=Candidatus Chloroploca mongolica TaxID=2528176 RepID=A0ABS4D708_9CHLR|nr:hypothetical protein [Candidatus Chloroploca mongolica]MBP1465221.1 hypothetical protein [Candidatus Chloroploca mongolica]